MSSQFELPLASLPAQALMPPSLILHLPFLLTDILAVQIEADSGSASGQWVLLKGAPEVVQPMLEQVPGGFEAAYKQFASQGARRVRLNARLAFFANPSLHRVAAVLIHAHSSLLQAGHVWSLPDAGQRPDLGCVPQACSCLQ